MLWLIETQSDLLDSYYSDDAVDADIVHFGCLLARQRIGIV